MPEPSPEREDMLVIRKTIPVPREKVFAAWLDPQGMKYWMCPAHILSTEAQLDPRVGGSFRIVMKGKDRDYEHTGEYRVIEPPSKIVFTWVSDGTDHKPTLVTVELFERGQHCELVLTHERFPRPDKVQAHKLGWSEIVDLLADYLQKHHFAKRRG